MHTLKGTSRKKLSWACCLHRTSANRLCYRCNTLVILISNFHLKGKYKLNWIGNWYAASMKKEHAAIASRSKTRRSVKHVLSPLFPWYSIIWLHARCHKSWLRPGTCIDEYSVKYRRVTNKKIATKVYILTCPLVVQLYPLVWWPFHLFAPVLDWRKSVEWLCVS